MNNCTFVIDRPYVLVTVDLLTVYIHFYLAGLSGAIVLYIVCKILMFTCISEDNCSSGCITLIPVMVVLCHVKHELNV